MHRWEYARRGKDGGARKEEFDETEIQYMIVANEMAFRSTEHLLSRTRVINVYFESYDVNRVIETSYTARICVVNFLFST